MYSSSSPPPSPRSGATSVAAAVSPSSILLRGEALPPLTVLRKTESILMIIIFIAHFVVAVTSLNITINDERDAAVATQSAWDMFDSSGAGAWISDLASSSLPFAWQSTAAALVGVTQETMPRFFGGALELNASTYSAASAATLGNDQIRPLHVVSNSLRLVQHRTMAPRMCENEVLGTLGESYFLLNSPSLAGACPSFSSGANSKRSTMRCCIREFDSTELSTEAESSSFQASTNASLTFRRVEAQSSVLFSGSGVESALRPGDVFYPFTGFSLDVRYSADLKTVMVASDGVPLVSSTTALGSPDVESTIRSFVDPLTRYIRLSILAIYWGAAVCVHLHVHIEMSATGAAVFSWRKAYTVPLRPGLFGSPSPTIKGSTSEALFSASYNTGLVVAEVFAIFCLLTCIICTGIRYHRFFRRDPNMPLWLNARLLLDVTTGLSMLVFFFMRLIIGAQISQFADALRVANNYDGTPVSRATDFVSGSWTRFIDSLRGGSAVVSFAISVIFVVRFSGVVLQTVRRVLNAKTRRGAPEIAEDERNGATSIELLPAVLRRFFIDAFRLLTWAMAPMFILCAMALSVLRGPNEFAWSYAGSSLGTLIRDRTLNLFGGFIVSRSKGASSYWETAQTGSYWADLIVGTVIEALVPLVFFAGLVFVAVRSQQEDVLLGKGKSAYFHHEDEEEARILQMQLFPTAPPKMPSSPPVVVVVTEAPASSSPANKAKDGGGADKDDEEMKDLEPPGARPAAGTPVDSVFGSTIELQNEAARRRLVNRLRQLSESLRNRLGLVPPPRVQEDRMRLQQQQQQRGDEGDDERQRRQGPAGPRRSVSWAADTSDNNNRGSRSISFNNTNRSNNNNNNNNVPLSAEERDPYLHVPPIRDVAREAAIERLLRARKLAEAKGTVLSPEEELAALRGPLPKNVQSAIDRMSQLYEDLTTLLTAGKTIRDALLEDTKKTVDQIEAELTKADEKKQREIEALNEKKQVATQRQQQQQKTGGDETIEAGDGTAVVVGKPIVAANVDDQVVALADISRQPEKPAALSASALASPASVKAFPGLAPEEMKDL